MQEAFVTGDMVQRDEISIKGQETAEISHIDVTFITVLMTMTIGFDQKFYVIAQIEQDINVEIIFGGLSLNNTLIIILCKLFQKDFIEAIKE